MHIYSRILTYAGPIKKYASYYFIAVFLSIFFGLTTYCLVTPLLKILFNQTELCLSYPAAKIRMGYLTHALNTCFITIIINHGKIFVLFLLAFLFILSTLLNGFFRYLADTLMAKICISVVYNLRLALFKKILEFPLQRFTDKKQGDLMACITTDMQEIEHAIADTLRLFLKEPTQLFCYVTALFCISSKLSLFTLVWLPIAGWTIAKIIKQLRKWAEASQHSLGTLMHLIEEMLNGIRIIKIFGAQSYAIDQFKQESKVYMLATRSVADKEYMSAPISESLSVIAISMILVYGGYLILLDTHILSASTFITYFIICTQTLIPIKMIARSISRIQRGMAAGKRIFTLLDEKSELSRPLLGDTAYTTFTQAITFNKVSFSYNAEQQILTNISFTIHKGETIAIVGVSGAGKSTLLALLSGLYKPNRGEIAIDQLSITQMSNSSLSRLMSIVTQESILFHDTILNNIAFNRRGIGKAEIIKAAKLACAHHFIMELPKGYHTIIGAHGDKLSGGQKQRICIARALVGDPPILILDEATSSLDSTSEKEIQEKLQVLIRHKTSIIVAHRLSTIYHIDRILVLDKGSIAEEGTHEELLAQGGLYKKLFYSQQH